LFFSDVIFRLRLSRGGEMTRKGSIAVLSVCLTLVCLPQAGFGADWVCIDPPGAVCTRYYDQAGMEYYFSGNLVRVRLKVMVDDGLIKQTLTLRKENGYALEGWDKWSHIVYLDEIYCTHKIYRTLNSSDYDSNGNVLEQSEYPDKRWSVIPSDTVENRLYGKVCSQKKDTKKESRK
jgi:hypothetical protein